MIKKIIRPVKKTILIVGEGKQEQNFLLYLKELFAFSNTRCRIKIEAATGISPTTIVEMAVDLNKNEKYDSTYILLDTDLSYEKAQELANRHNYKLILSYPMCLEGLLLSIIDNNLDYNLKSSMYKSMLHQIVGITQNTKGNLICKQDFKNHFPASVLTKTSNKTIKLLISIMEGTP